MLNLIKYNKNKNLKLDLKLFNEGIELLEKTYNKKYTNDQKNILYSLIINYGNDFFISAIRQTIETHPYTTLPPIGEIINNGKEQQNNKAIIQTLEMRQKILKLIKNSTKTYILDDPITKKVIDLLGGLRYLGQLEPKELNILLATYLQKTIQALENNTVEINFNDIILGDIDDDVIRISGDIKKITEILKKHDFTEEQKNKLLDYGIDLKTDIKKLDKSNGE